MKAMIKEHRINKELYSESLKNNIDIDIFYKSYIVNHPSSNTIFYPGFHLIPSRSINLGRYWRTHICSLFHKSLNSFKTIILLGNSSLRGDYLREEETISYFVQERLGCKYKIINLGVNGYTIYEQMLLYNAVLFAIKPDFVISIAIGADWEYGLITCKRLLKEWKMIYSPTWEHNIQSVKKISTLNKMRYLPIARKYLNNDDKINEAIVFRIKQFKKIVETNNGIFLCFCQILSPFKKYLTQKEQIARNNELSLKDRALKELLNKRVYNLHKLLIKNIGNKKYFYDCNKIIKDSKNTIFDMDYIHQNEYGSKITADFIAEKIKERIKEKDKKKKH